MCVLMCEVATAKCAYAHVLNPADYKLSVDAGGHLSHLMFALPLQSSTSHIHGLPEFLKRTINTVGTSMPQLFKRQSIVSCMFSHAYEHPTSEVVNPRRACAARVTVVGSVCLSVCLSVCPLPSFCLHERAIVL